MTTESNFKDYRWASNPPLKKALSKGPYMFGLLAVPFIEKYGAECKEYIHDFIYEMAIDSGKKRAEKTVAAGGDIDDLLGWERRGIEDFGAEGMNSPGFDDPAREWKVKTKPLTVVNLSKCEGCETDTVGAWKELGYDADTIRMLSQIFCWPWDEGARKGFNPRIKFSFNKLEPEGDEYCEFVTEITDESSYESTYHERRN
jgi:hypothetical protein|tara:strand:- start:3369 stop:3971 length:603 start_codon:yes stop_codon:yes gene_type:complete